jgi:flagellar protein FliJ
VKRFKFRLQSVLNVAEKREESARHDLASAKAAENELHSQLDAMEGSWLEWEDKLRKEQKGILDLKRLQDHSEILSRLQCQMVEKRKELAEAERISAAMQALLIELSKERRSLERMREKQMKAHTAECAAKEVKATDDLISTRIAAARGTHGVASSSVITG